MHDPGRAALRRAGRTTLVTLPLFAVNLLVVGNPQTTLFTAFGPIAMLAFADFSGPPRRRARAYLGLTVIGCALIAAATPLSGTPWAAAAGMAAVGFAIAFAGAFGGYLAAGGIAATLAFVLAVAVQADAAEIPARLAGWGEAGAASLLAAVLLWPAFERSRLIRLAADLAEGIGRLAQVLVVPTSGADDASARREVVALSERLAGEYAGLPYRPAGPTLHDQSILYLVSELRRGEEFVTELSARPAPLRDATADAQLLGAIAATFQDVGQALREGRDPASLEGLEKARREQMRAFEEELGSTTPAANVAERVHQAFLVRILSYIALSASANTSLLHGKTVPDPGFEIEPLVPDERLGGTLERLVGLVRAQLRLDSVWLQAALRAGLALGIAVLVALLARLDHAFWVVLGTMTSLKSSAVTTSYTAWQSLLGTSAGFGIAAGFVLAVDESTTAFWAALPVVLFLAIYTPTAVHAVVGQAMFTVTVVLLFNLIEPEGWRVGLVRVEDILIGVATSIVVGLFLWPRGARRQLAARVGALFEAGSAYVQSATGRALGHVTPDAIEVAREDARDSAARATDAFSTVLNERGPRRLPLEVWTRVLGAGHQLRFVGDSIVARTDASGTLVAPPEAARPLEESVAELERAFADTGRSVADPAVGLPSVPGDVPPLPVVNVAGPETLVQLLWLREWACHVRQVLARIEEPVRKIRSAEALPWWR